MNTIQEKVVYPDVFAVSCRMKSRQTPEKGATLEMFGITFYSRFSRHP